MARLTRHEQLKQWESDIDSLTAKLKGTRYESKIAKHGTRSSAKSLRRKLADSFDLKRTYELYTRKLSHG